jgi:hypothetical protein
MENAPRWNSISFSLSSAVIVGRGNIPQYLNFVSLNHRVHLGVEEYLEKVCIYLPSQLESALQICT